MSRRAGSRSSLPAASYPQPVIPAKAGIHTPAYRYAAGPPPGFWIPAYAGMTVGQSVR